MVKELLCAGIALFLSLSTFSQDTRYFRFTRADTSDLTRITRQISIDNVTDSLVYAYATEKQFRNFKKNSGYSLTVLPSRDNRKKNMRIAGNVKALTDWDKYPTYTTYLDIMQKFVTRYPGLCEVDTIGKSEQGRFLLVMRITDNISSEEAEPECFYTSTIHGDEPAGYVLMLRFIDYLLSNYGENQEITSLVNNLEIFINPLANPDGTYIGGDSAIWEAQRYNANYVDLNRNFPDFDNGPHPDNNAWQSETKAMMDFARNNSITLSANFHSGAELVNYPWDTKERGHPDEEWFITLGHVYADSAIANSPDGYFTAIDNDGVINGFEWYPIYGSRQDYMTYYTNSREVTIEISGEKMLPADQLPEYWNYNKEGLIQFLYQSLYGIHGTVTDSAGNPLNAMVFVENHDTSADSSMIFTDQDSGDFHRLIAPGTYDITFVATGYKEKTVKNIYIGEQQRKNLDIVLEKDADTDVEKPVAASEKIRMYPNPFQKTLFFEIRIKRTLPVNISIFTLEGKEIWSTYKMFQGRGSIVQWPGITNTGSEVLPGLYIYRITIGMQTYSGKVLKR